MQFKSDGTLKIMQITDMQEIPTNSPDTLALLDEAFSRMTSDRIRPMMQMLRKMQLQTVLITTVEKASAIQPYCDSTCSIIISGTRNAVRPFYQDVRE